MTALNSVTIIGNLGKDPEIQMVPNTMKKVAKFSVGVTEKYVDKYSQKHEKTEWFNVVLWNNDKGKGLASIAEQYLKKGSLVYIEGKQQTRSWDDPSGGKKYRVELIGNTLKMLGGKLGNVENSAPVDVNNGNAEEYPPDDDLPF